VARIDGEALTLGDLLIRYANLPQPQRDRYAARREGLRDFLADTAANIVIAREAERLGLSAEPLYETLMKIRREEVLRDLYARRTVLQPIDESTVQARYEALRDTKIERQATVRVRHILATPVTEEVPPNETGDDAVGGEVARKKIERIRQQLMDGADFATLARRLSEDASAPDGGDLGWVVQGDLVPGLSKVAFKLELDAISPVFETELGHHVIQVVDRRPGGTVPLELVRELIFQELVGERAPELMLRAAEDRDALVESHDVELFPERLPW
jgi:parvulin-like peptidyl-prolyl isomerase